MAFRCVTHECDGGADGGSILSAKPRRVGHAPTFGRALGSFGPRFRWYRHVAVRETALCECVDNACPLDHSTGMMVWPEVRAVNWAELRGARGMDCDVAGALETLRFGTDPEADDFGDAWQEVLYSHVYNQGAVFPVTAHVLPFVFDIVDQSPALKGKRGGERTELAQFVLCCAAAAQDEQSSDGRAVLATLALHAERLRAWVLSDLRSLALATMLNVPRLANDVAAGREASLRHVLAAVFEQAQLLDSRIVIWAGEELSRLSPHPVAARARQLLLRATRQQLQSGDGRLDALAKALERAGDLELHLHPLRELFGIFDPMGVAGESPGVVVVVDDDWFVVQAARKVTIRWRAHPFAEGDEVVLVDINDQNCARALRGTGNKAHLQASFDARGALRV
jgi:hypothetical protein